MPNIRRAQAAASVGEAVLKFDETKKTLQMTLSILSIRRARFEVAEHDLLGA